MLITLRGFFKSDYVQPQTHNTLNANFRVSGNVKRAVRDTQTDRWGGGGGGGGGGGSDTPKTEKKGRLRLFEFE